MVVSLTSGETQYFETGKMQTNDADGQTDTGLVRAFIQSIVTNTPPEISGEEGRRALTVILACMESAKTGRHVAVCQAD